MAKKTALAVVVKKPINPDAWVKAKPKDATMKPARLVVEIPEDMHARIKVKCAQERIKIKEATERLFQQWLDGHVHL